MRVFCEEYPHVLLFRSGAGKRPLPLRLEGVDLPDLPGDEDGDDTDRDGIRDRAGPDLPLAVARGDARQPVKAQVLRRERALQVDPPHSPAAQHLDDGEFLEVEKIPLETLVEQVLSGEVKDSKTQAALLKTWILKGRK